MPGHRDTLQAVGGRDDVPTDTKNPSRDRNVLLSTRLHATTARSQSIAHDRQHPTA